MQRPSQQITTYSQDTIDAFAHIERGIDPELNPQLNYEPFLPYVASLYPHNEYPAFLSNYPKFRDVISYQTIDCDALKVSSIPHALPDAPEDNDAMQISLEGDHLRFEKGDPTAKANMLMDQLVTLMSLCRSLSSRIWLGSFWLLESRVHLSEVLMILPVLLEKKGQMFKYQELLPALMMLKQGAELARCVVANDPAAFHEIICILLNGPKNLPSLVPECQNRIRTTLQGLFQLAPHHAPSIRQRCTVLEQFPSLVLSITQTYCKDQLTYMNAILTDNPAWLTQEPSLVSSDLSEIKRCLFIELDKQMSGNSPNDIQLCMLVRILCGLAGIFNVRFSSTEVDMWLAIGDRCKGSERLSNLFLCLCLICSNYVVQIAQSTLVASLSTVVRSPHAEMLLLLAVYFHTGQVAHVEELVCEVLGMQVTISPVGLAEMDKVFKQNLLSDAVIAEQALKLSLINSMGKAGAGATSLALTTFYQLLHGNVFSRANVDISGWIHEHIIICSKPPINPLVVPLLKEYAESTFVSPSIKRLSEAQVLKPFRVASVDTKQKTTAPQVLMLFYVLQYNEFAFSHCGQLAVKNSSAEYSSTLVNSLSLRQILDHAATADGGTKYQALYPELLALAISQFPHLFDVSALITEEGRSLSQTEKNTGALHRLRNIMPTDGRISRILFMRKLLAESLTNPNGALLTLRFLQEQNASDLLPHWKMLISALLPNILDARTDPRITKSFKTLWESLNKVVTADLWVMTINRLRPTEDGTSSQYSQQDLIGDPLLLFRSDWKVFRCPPIYDILLKILRSLMVASRHQAKKQLKVATSNSQVLNFKDQHLSAMLYSQDALVMQMLLEVCLKTDEDRFNPAAVKEIRRASFDFLHQQLFVENVIYLKLLLFQTYPAELLHATVAGIPSMHVCLTYLAELMALPDREKQIFGIQLAGFVCEKYPLDTSMTIARDHVLPRIRSYIQALQNSIGLKEREGLMQAVVVTLPTTRRVYRTFPSLMPLVSSLLGEAKGMVETDSRRTEIGNLFRSTTEEVFGDLERDMAEKGERW